MRNIRVFLILIGMTASWGSVNASVININMVNHPNGPASVDGPFGLHHHHQRYINLKPWDPTIAYLPYEGSDWNNLLNGDVHRRPGSLQDSEGNVTQVGMTMSDLAPGSFTFSYGGSSTNTNEIKDNYLAIADTWAHPVTLTFTNLDRDKTYDFIMYSQSGEGDQAGGQFLAGGSNGPIGGVSSGEGRYTQDHIPGVNIAVIEGVIPNQNREIVMVMYSFGEGEDLILNGMQICSIPEPSATFLVMLSSLGLLRRRRS